MKFLKPSLQTVIITALFLLFLQLGTFYSLINFWKNDQKQIHFEYQIALLEHGIKAMEKRSQTLANMSFEHDVNQPYILELLDKGSKIPNNQVNPYREKLLHDLMPTFNVLKHNSVRQFQFHLPQSISFLRFHKPEKYGDSLQGTRKTVDWVNKYHKKVSAFEEGRVNDGFRYVYPLFYHNTFIGSVEYGFSHDSIHEELQELYNVHSELILYKKHVDETNFSDAMNIYATSSLGNEFYIDQSHRSKDGFSHSLLDNINHKIDSTVHKQLTNKKAFGVSTQVAKEFYTVLFIPVISFGDGQVGYTVVYQKGQEIALIEEHFKHMLIIGSISISLVTFLLTFLYYRLQIRDNELQKMAYTDKLTGIANRMSLNIDLKYHCKLSKRLAIPFSLIFFDIDFFKKVNDTYGHDGGDIILQELSNLVQSRLRITDMFGRWGGEEFMILLPDTSIEDAKLLSEALRESIEKMNFSICHINCSFGVATLYSDETIDDLVKRADNKLYESKNNGRNKVSA